jgi:hypothetical protein
MELCLDGAVGRSREVYAHFWCRRLVAAISPEGVCFRAWAIRVFYRVLVRVLAKVLGPVGR